eukprot:TRINITY_DN23707_c0_g1_i1.p1 TRINITY_DN23707_c0_g1~~TRINITY_DN23707_c0_g1_i1.p1  ORF type:complete len:888 (+),score=62.09 TRINITY_DN23707_c0_g1_i1:131-2794(+)
MSGSSSGAKVKPFGASRCSVKFPPRPSSVPLSRGIVRPLGNGSGDSSPVGGGVRAIFGRSRSLVYPPSGWKESKRDLAPPDRVLHRDYVYGYNGDSCTSVHFISEIEYVYPVAGLVVIGDSTKNTQRFFTGHSNDVRCVSWNACRRICASGQGDVKGAVGPFICIWAPAFCAQTISELHYHDRCVHAIGISDDGLTVVSFGGDDGHTMAIWRDFATWDGVTGPPPGDALRPERPAECKIPLHTVRSGPAMTDSILMSPQSDGVDELVFHTLGKAVNSSGRRHFKFWSVRFPDRTRPGRVPEVRSSLGNFGSKHAQVHPMNMSPTAETGVALMAADDGNLYVVRASSVSDKLTCLARAPSTCTVSLGCVAVLPGGRAWIAGGSDGTIVVGSFQARGLRVDERLLLADLGGEAALFQSTTVPKLAHVSAGPSGVAIFGTSNHALLLVDLQRRELRVLQVSHEGETQAMDFHPDLQILATGSTARELRFWNVADRRPAVGRVLRMESSIASVAFSSDGSLLAVGLFNGVLRILAFPSLESVFQRSISRNRERICELQWFLCSTVGTLLAAACWDQAIYLLRLTDVERPDRSVQLVLHKTLHGHSSSPTSLMISACGSFIMSNSKDSQILFWRVTDGVRQPAISAFRDMEWQRCWTCLLGWPVIGIWSDPKYDGTDVNSVCQSLPPDQHCIVSGDDFGQVNLFRFPCPRNNPPYLRYGGHSSHVTMVRFSHTNVLIALGGGDHSISQWTLERATQRRSQPQPLMHPWLDLAESDAPRDRFAYLGRDTPIEMPRDGMKEKGAMHVHFHENSAMRVQTTPTGDATSSVASYHPHVERPERPQSAPRDREFVRSIGLPGGNVKLRPGSLPSRQAEAARLRNTSQGVGSALVWDD